MAQKLDFPVKKKEALTKAKNCRNNARIEELPLPKRIYTDGLEGISENENVHGPVQTTKWTRYKILAGKQPCEKTEHRHTHMRKNVGRAQQSVPV